MNKGHESYRQIDAKSGAFIVIAQEHHKIHSGESFERHIDSANVAVAALNFAFKTGPGPVEAHMFFGWHSNDETLFTITRGATWTQGSGVATPFFNHNQSSNKDSVAILENKNQSLFTASNEVIKNVTGVSGGTIFEQQYTYNAGIPQATSPESRAAGHEWVLAPDTTYVINAAKTDANCKISLDMHFYETNPLNEYPDDIIFVPRW